MTGDRLPSSRDLDYVFIIGVLHHIPEPDPVVAASFRALTSGGKLAVWLYGREGNSLYLLLVRTLWTLTRRLPHRMLEWLVAAMYPFFWCYMTACLLLPLPLAAYMRRVMIPLTPAKRRVVIYDQLNPAYAKYYTRQEAHDALARHGFIDIRLPPHGHAGLSLERVLDARQPRRAGLQRGCDATGIHGPGRARAPGWPPVTPSSSSSSTTAARTEHWSWRKALLPVNRGCGWWSCAEISADRGAPGGPDYGARRSRGVSGLGPAALSRGSPALPNKIEEGYDLVCGWQHAARKACCADGRRAPPTC